MKSGRIDIGSIRREQIVDAAVSVIAEQGIQNLSLSEIEKKVGMSRGQLTYYFRAKDEILLAVFDRLLQMMCQQAAPEGGQAPQELPFFALLDQLLEMLLQQPPAHPEFHALQYTFLSQISHRADFRSRLANLYEEWRSAMAGHLQGELEQKPARRPVSPRAVATLVQAILHGLAVQTSADPEALDPREMRELAMDMLQTYLWGQPVETSHE